MDKTSNYFPKTITALTALKETASLLEQNAHSVQIKNKKLQNTATELRRQISDKAIKIEKIIKKLNGAIK